MLREQKEGSDKGEDVNYSEKFYNILPFRCIHRTSSIVETQVLYSQYETCQVLRDMLITNEATNRNFEVSNIEKYRSIGSYIKYIDENSDEYAEVKNHVLNSVDTEKMNNEIKIINVYSILRPNESENFNDTLSNNRLLFYGLNARNIVGVLSRGLLLPNYVSNEDTGQNHFLGRGIYFSDCVNTSLKNSSISSIRNTRYVVLCDVALGNCKDYFDFDHEITEEPEGFNSTHGVKYITNDEVESNFEDNEYVIYNTSQQQIRYLIELQYENDGAISSLESLFEPILENDQIESDFFHMDLLKEIEELEISKNIIESGLFVNNGESVPLKSIHVRVQLLDMISRVIIFQEYENLEEYPVEAKYLFPLDDENTAICDFEAFVNDKHIIGICKEKEQAYKEYREAIEKGYGAYMIDQESSSQFKVNIGNLPPKSRCIIKITYVGELSVENENIVFRLPNYIAPWEAFKNNEIKENSFVKSCFESLIQENNKKLSLEISVQMPFEIRSIYSPTHSVDVKQKSCCAVLKMSDGQTSLSETFILNISTSTIHVPRIFVEDSSLCAHTRACMLSFYPEFEKISKSESPHVIFLIDSSNSMSGNSFNCARKLLGYMLKNVPQKCYFNIISFSSTFEQLFPFSTTYDRLSLDKAFNFVKKLKTTNANTTLLKPLQEFLLINQNELTNFILISDGHINEPQSLLRTLKNKTKLRFFCCAIGSNPNKHLLKMISYSTNGSFSQFDSKFQTKWKDKVQDLIEKLYQPPAISHISVEWETSDDDNQDKILQAPIKINPLFNGKRQVVYGFVPNCLMATLKAKLDGQDVSTVVSCTDLMITNGTIIHKLTAKSLINDWQYGILSDDKLNNEILKSKVKDKIIEMSKEYCIASEYTTLIAIDERNEGEIVNTTPTIDDLLSEDVDAFSIDILPDISFATEYGKKIKDDKFERMLNKIFEKYTDMNDGELNELNKLLNEFKEKIHETYSCVHPIRLKYDELRETFEEIFGNTDTTKFLPLDSTSLKSKIPKEKQSKEKRFIYKPLIQLNSNSFCFNDYQNALTRNSEITITNTTDSDYLDNFIPSFDILDHNLIDTLDIDLSLDYLEEDIKKNASIPFYTKTICKGPRRGRGGKGLGKGCAAKKARIIRSESGSRSCSRNNSECDSSISDNSSKISNSTYIHTNPESEIPDKFGLEDEKSLYSQHEFFSEWKKIKKTKIDLNKKYWTNNENSMFRSFLLCLTKVNWFYLTFKFYFNN